MKNILSFDVEAWCDSFFVKNKDELLKEGNRVEIGVKKILELLEPKQIKATFFIVGKLAEEDPEIVKMIDNAGHEVASHSYSHKPVSSLSPEEFKEDLLRSIKVLKDITGKDVLGFRAPGYTITKDTLWALDIIKDCGLKYDSSIYPVSLRLFTRGGVAGFPQKHFQIREGLKEFPLITTDLFGIKVPIATTSYFRLFPYLITKWAVKRLNNKGIGATLNYHSWEFDPKQPKVKLPFPQNIKHYANLKLTEKRFTRLINDFNFVPCREAL
ncbi:MAG: polysaccharide deacetylase family protein [Candidatus Margulisiibacteriota bacterium]|nr:polysaccharide deacetylase family protein [Candidatus Margulisiibacteriota bacterium]